MTKTIILALCVAAVAGCASMDRAQFTSMIPPAPGADPSVVRIKIVADPIHREDSSSSEADRLDWVNWSLKENGYDPAHAMIVKRTPVFIAKSLIGPIYDVYYDVKVSRD